MPTKTKPFESYPMPCDYSFDTSHFDSIVEFADGLQLGGGRQFTVLPFHKKFLSSILDPNITTACLSISRKNTKTSWIAVICVWALLHLKQWKAGVVSLTGTQTEVLQNMMLSITEELAIPNHKTKGILFTSGHRPAARNHFNGSSVHFYSTSSSVGHGVVLNCSIIDEIGLIPETKIPIVQQMRDATSAFDDGKTIAISVRGTSSAFNDMYESSKTSEHTSWLEFRADHDDPISDIKTWKKANPSLGIAKSLKWLDAEYNTAKVSSTKMREFEVYHLNKQLDARTKTLLPINDWLSCCVDSPLELGTEIVVGIDVGDALSGSAAVFYDFNSGAVQWILAYPSEPSLSERGKLNGLGQLLQKCRDQNEIVLLGEKSMDLNAFMDIVVDTIGHRRAYIACDHWRKNRMLDLLSAAGVTYELFTHRPGWKQATEDLENLEFEVKERKIKPYRSLSMELSLSQSTVKEDGMGNITISRSRGVTSQNDLGMALLMAASRGRQLRESTPEFHVPNIIGKSYN